MGGNKEAKGQCPPKDTEFQAAFSALDRVKADLEKTNVDVLQAWREAQGELTKSMRNAKKLLLQGQKSVKAQCREVKSFLDYTERTSRWFDCQNLWPQVKGPIGQRNDQGPVPVILTLAAGTSAMAHSRWGVESLFLVLTNSCNLSCTYCHQTRLFNSWMDLGTAEAAIRHLLRGRIRNVRLLLTGGEPLLDFDYVQRLVRLVRELTPSGRSVPLTYSRTEHDSTRNGQVISPGTELGYRFSLDGTEPAQRLRGESTFRSLDALIRCVRDRHNLWFQHRVSAALTLVPETIPCLADSFEYPVGLQFSEIAVSPAMGPMPGWHEGLTAILDRQLARVFRVSLRQYRRVGVAPLDAFRKIPARHDRAGAIRSAASRVGPSQPSMLMGRYTVAHLASDRYYRPAVVY